MSKSNVRLSLLAAALATTASAWAAYELKDSVYVPAPAEGTASAGIGATAEPVVVAEPETVVTTTPPAAAPLAPEPRPVAMPAPEARQPSITIEKPRLSVDQRIQADVIDLLARSPNLSGKIGVETHDRVVTLSGFTYTSGQAWRAGRAARSVEGVREVRNEIRARVGGTML